MKKRKLQKKLERSRDRVIDLDARLRRYEDMHKWMVDHAPATLARYPGEAAAWRPSTLTLADAVIRKTYAPAIRRQLEMATPIARMLGRG